MKSSHGNRFKALMNLLLPKGPDVTRPSRGLFHAPPPQRGNKPTGVAAAKREARKRQNIRKRRPH